MRLSVPKNALCLLVRPLMAGLALLCVFLAGLIASPWFHLSAIALASSPPSTEILCYRCPTVRTVRPPDINSADPERLIRLYRVPLLRVVDGDTIRVYWCGEDTGVRLLCIDAPERGQPGYHNARHHLESLLDDADQIDLEFEHDHPARDRYGRLLAYLHHNGRNLNAAMVHTGHAVVFDRYGPGKYAKIFHQKSIPP